eukprot:COSAG02_NODE_1030_length_15077_cov_36.210119_4_plen_63_part_00
MAFISQASEIEWRRMILCALVGRKTRSTHTQRLRGSVGAFHNSSAAAAQSGQTELQWTDGSR